MLRREEWRSRLTERDREAMLREMDAYRGEFVRGAVDSGVAPETAYEDLYRLGRLVSEYPAYASNFVDSLDGPDKDSDAVAEEWGRGDGMFTQDEVLREENRQELEELARKYPECARADVDYEKWCWDQEAERVQAESEHIFSDAELSEKKKRLEEMIPRLAMEYGDDGPQAYKDLWRLYDLADMYPEYEAGVVRQFDREDGTFEEGYGPFTEEEIAADESGLTGRLSELRELTLKYPEFARPLAEYESAAIAVEEQHFAEQDSRQTPSHAPDFEPAFTSEFDMGETPMPQLGPENNFDAMLDGFVSNATQLGLDDQNGRDANDDVEELAFQEWRDRVADMRGQDEQYFASEAGYAAEVEAAAALADMEAEAAREEQIAAEVAEVAEEQRQLLVADMQRAQFFENLRNEIVDPYETDPDIRAGQEARYAEAVQEHLEYEEMHDSMVDMDASRDVREQQEAAFEQAWQSRMAEKEGGTGVEAELQVQSGCDKSLSGLDLAGDTGSQPSAEKPSGCDKSLGGLDLNDGAGVGSPSYEF